MSHYPPPQPPSHVPYAQSTGGLMDPYGYHIQRDHDHLRLLKIFHYIYGPVVMLFSCIFIFHIVMGIMMLNNPRSFQGPNAPPREIGYMFIGIGAGAVLIGWTLGILNIVSARMMAQRRWRIFSLVVAGIDCINVPLGVILGVFTFIVLLRDSVKHLYQEVAEGRQV